jgi:DNA-binding winged helix-turn-helix (wHTH) protein/tetratricopeptide (TPR) repeat protein
MGKEFHVGEWLVQPDLNCISKPDKVVPVEPKVLEVLVFLSGNAGEVLSRDTILKSVWAGTYVSDEVLTYSISELRKAFEDDAKKPRYIQTIPRKGYRLIAPVSNGHKPDVERAAPVVEQHEAEAIRLREQEDSHTESVPEPQISPAGHTETPELSLSLVGATGTDRRKWIALALAVLAVITLASVWYLSSSPTLAETDFILLAEFSNKTGDPVFDDTMKDALTIHLRQSPFLNIYPESRARETLPYMGRSQEEPITPETGREICQRRGIRAMLFGTIWSPGTHYAVELQAISAQTGDVIAGEQFEVKSKEEVLGALGTAADRLRRKLGESFRSMEKSTVPLEQATTTSLDAFKSYSLGRKNLLSGKMAEALPFYLRALEFDPNFASAYDDLAWCYDSMGEREKAADVARRAFELRDRVSEFERQSIASIYYTMATGEIDKAVEALEVIRTIHPRSAPVHNTLGGRYATLGLFDRAIESFKEAIRLTNHPNAFAGLASAYLSINNPAEAKDVLSRAAAQGIDNRDIRGLRFITAFMDGNVAIMQEQVKWAVGKPHELYMLGLQANAAAAWGRLGEARDLARQAALLASQKDFRGTGASIAAEIARWEAALGNNDDACAEIKASQFPLQDWRVLVRQASALLFCNDWDGVEAISESLASKYPTHTVVQTVMIPAFRAAVQARKGEPETALQTLRQLSSRTPLTTFLPAYLCGELYLMQSKGQEAVFEFMKIVNQRGLDPLSPYYPLAHLGVARGYALAGQANESRKAYQLFLNLWKNGDPTLPIIRQARAEYERLHRT